MAAQQMRKEWKKEPDRKFLLFFEFMGFLSLIFSFPSFFRLWFLTALGSWLLEKAAMELWLFAFAGEALADFQLLFKGTRGNGRKACRAGLWNYSRHPNYFFEWLVWCANALFALSSPYGAWALLCPF